ncbi:MAG: outer membrane lipoprotein-sorting protein [Burkholderiaceae bacterium]
MKSYADWLMKYRLAAIAGILILTGVLAAFAAQVKIVIDPVALSPQGHPYTVATNRVDAVFGSKYMVLIGVTPKTGEALQPAVLKTVRQLTDRLRTQKGIVQSTLLSLTAPQAKAMRGRADGMEVVPLIPSDDPNPAEILEVKRRLQANPVYRDLVLSRDGRTAVVMVELVERSDGFTAMVAPVRAAVEAFRTAGVDITLGGNPIYLEATENFAQRIEWLFPLAILLIGLLHFEAFRTWQGFVLPLVTALLAVVWGMGLMGMLGQSMDIFNSPTPILILAVAAGHSVQLLKRYYEELESLRSEAPYAQLGPRQLSVLAVQRCLIRVGPVMIAAGLVAAIGFLSLLAFPITTIRTFGLFTAGGILSALLIELTFTPAVRSLLAAPARIKPSARFWTAIPDAIGRHVTDARGRRRVLGIAMALSLLALIGSATVVVDNASKLFFAPDLPLQRDDVFLNRQTGGTNSLYIMIEGQAPDRMKDPAILRAMDELVAYGRALPAVGGWIGKSVSMTDFIRRMNQSMHDDDPGFNRIPETREAVSQYLLLYSLSGSPNDFDAYIDYDYQRTKITLLLRTGSNKVIEQLVGALQAKAKTLFPSDVTVSFGGDVAQTIALTETMVNGKLLNIAVVAGAILVVSSLLFGSLAAGLIVLLPLALAVLSVFGVMGGLRIPLNIPNSLIAAMAVGMGSDYAIYLLYRIRDYVRTGVGIDEAVRQALRSAGQASLFVATAVAGGYAVLAVSYDYMVHVWLALFIVVAMLVSVFASLYMVSICVVLFTPRFLMKHSLNNKQSPVLTWVLTACAAGTLAVVAHHDSVQAQTPPSTATVVDPRALMLKSDEASRVKDSTAQATFTLTNRSGNTRVRKIQGYSRQVVGGTQQMRLVRFVSPADIKGTSTLLIEHARSEDDIWVYLPSLGKVRRLSASQKKDAFIGTDFSYGDVIGHKVDEWNHALKGEEPIDGTPCWVVESTPVDDGVKNNTGYGRRVSWLRKNDAMPARQVFYDPAGQLLKRFTASDIRAVGKGRYLAYDSQVENLQTGHKTQLHYDDYKADTGLSADLFTTQELER